MPPFDDLSKKFATPLSSRPQATDPATLRELCAALLFDVPHDQRVAMLARLGTMRRTSDLWPLRSVLFDLIAHHAGEPVATVRLVELDRMLLPHTKPAGSL